MTEFISRNHGNSCYEIIIKTTDHKHYKESEDFARRLIDHAKPQSNGDRIRAMVDEVLGAFLMRVSSLELPVPFCQNKPECEELLNNDELTDAHCLGCMVAYLKRPAENEVSG